METSDTYDGLGEKYTETNPLGIVTQYGYDILGHLLQTIANYQARRAARPARPTSRRWMAMTRWGDR